MQHVFFNGYNPTENIFVYNNATPDSSVNNIYATGDQVAINGYINNSIQINASGVAEYTEVQICGRIAGVVNSPEWVVLSTNAFGAASADSFKSVLVDISSYHVDFIKVGIRRSGTNGANHVDVVGNFTNDYK
jgi:hypothetical protein